MNKTILITGSTDGIGLEAAKMLASTDHRILVHGRSIEKVERVIVLLKGLDSQVNVDGYVADLSSMAQVRAMAEAIIAKNEVIDVLINNAGVFMAENTTTSEGLELRFAVNTIAPYLLTKLLMPVLSEEARIVNLSSAAQSPVDIEAIATVKRMSNDQAYAQSKLAITMWSIEMAARFKAQGKKQIVVAVNPKSFLGSKMVKQAYGSDGHDIRIGGDILCRAALSDEFEDASGKYFDNDQGRFAMPHPDAMDEQIRIKLVKCLDEIIGA